MSVYFVFFKQKTAYEMRISDWSSDVCSSDLARHDRRLAQHHFAAAPVLAVDLDHRTLEHLAYARGQRGRLGQVEHRVLVAAGALRRGLHRRRQAGDRKSVVWGKSVSVRVDLGGGRLIKKTKQTKKHQ